MKAAIWSLSTVPDGLYVVGELPRVRPEKYASAISQKKTFPMTSVNGKVTVAPPHIPVSAGILIEVSRMMLIVASRTNAERSVLFKVSSVLCRATAASAPVETGLITAGKHR
jgi:hypothetical protein